MSPPLKKRRCSGTELETELEKEAEARIEAAITLCELAMGHFCYFKPIASASITTSNVVNDCNNVLVKPIPLIPLKPRVLRNMCEPFCSM